MGSNFVRALVSKQKRRFKNEDFDLDLSSDRVEGLYRNHIDDVAKFLDREHKDRYFVYNLRKDSTYDPSKFHGRVLPFMMDDHHPPALSIFLPFCEHVHNWLSADPANVIVVHCKAGKGRTGVMICAYLLYSGHCRSTQEALDFYAENRTLDLKGVTIPSQRRYVDYFAQMLANHRHPKSVHMVIKSVHLLPTPTLGGNAGHSGGTAGGSGGRSVAPYFNIHCMGKHVYKSQVYTTREADSRHKQQMHFNRSYIAHANGAYAASLHIDTTQRVQFDLAHGEPVSPYMAGTSPPDRHGSMFTAQHTATRSGADGPPRALSSSGGVCACLCAHIHAYQMCEQRAGTSTFYTSHSMCDTSMLQTPAHTGLSMHLPPQDVAFTLCTGDVLIEVYNKASRLKGIPPGKDKLFHFWFNTFFVCEDAVSTKTATAASVNHERVTHTRSSPARDCPILQIEQPQALSADQRRCVSESLPSVPSMDDDDEHDLPIVYTDMEVERVRRRRLADQHEFVTNFGPVPDGCHLLTLYKSELDSACKDTKHQRFAADFKVFVVTRCCDLDEVKCMIHTQRANASSLAQCGNNALAETSVSSVTSVRQAICQGVQLDLQSHGGNPSPPTIETDAPSTQSLGADTGAVGCGLYVNEAAPYEQDELNQMMHMCEQLASEGSHRNAAQYAVYPPPSVFDPSSLQQSSVGSNTPTPSVSGMSPRQATAVDSQSPHKCPLWAIPSAFAFDAVVNAAHDDLLMPIACTIEATTEHRATGMPASCTNEPINASTDSTATEIHFSSDSEDDSSDDNIGVTAAEATSSAVAGAELSGGANTTSAPTTARPTRPDGCPFMMPKGRVIAVLDMHGRVLPIFDKDDGYTQHIDQQHHRPSTHTPALVSPIKQATASRSLTSRFRGL